MPNLAMPNEALPYILYQRTEYLSHFLAHRLLKRVVTRCPAFQHTAIRLESALYKKEIIHAFSADMQSEAASLLPYLPSPCERILDIGCGVAGVDAYLSRSLQGEVDIYLLDKTQVDSRVYYKFERQGSFYSSLDVARRMLQENGVPSERIHTEEATEDGRVQAAPGLDLAISLISWGFHYPVATYLEQVYTLLRPGGRLILDVRKDTDGEERLRERFTGVERIQEAKRSFRVLAIK